MIDKTSAIALRLAPSGDTSRVVTWLTPDHGRIATILKGALRPKSAFLGQVDLFYTCELLYYRRDQREVYLARECAPIKMRTSFRHDWRACAAASYFTDLATRASPSHAPQRFLYHWLDQALDECNQHGIGPALWFWLELRLLKLLGLAPRLEHCLACGTALIPGKHQVAFSEARGGLLCAACARTDPQTALPVPPDVWALLRTWQSANDPSRARVTRCNERQRVVLERLLGLFLRYHLDLPLPSRDLALSIQKR